MSYISLFLKPKLHQFGYFKLCLKKDKRLHTLSSDFVHKDGTAVKKLSPWIETDLLWILCILIFGSRSNSLAVYYSSSHIIKLYQWVSPDSIKKQKTSGWVSGKNSWFRVAGQWKDLFWEIKNYIQTPESQIFFSSIHRIGFACQRPKPFRNKSSFVHGNALLKNLITVKVFWLKNVSRFQ